jgi:hypothetical protein
MLLHLDKASFKEIMSQVSSQLGYSEDQIEKDYYVSLFLKELLNLTDLQIVFKGGTSLSKAYHTIDRFSEDLDIAVDFEGLKLGDGKRKKLKYQIIDVAKKLSMNVMNAQSIESDREFNAYIIEYEHQFKQHAAGLPYILVETIVSYKPFPCEEKMIYNYITNYLIEINRTDLIKKYQLEPYPALVQTMERTFIDKLFAICDYHLERRYERYSRHLYDVHMIWQSEQLNKTVLHDLGFKVAKDRQLYGTSNFSCMPNAKPYELLNQIIDGRVYEKDYSEVTSEFIINQVDYDLCIQSLKEIIKMNYLPEIIENYQ